MVKAVIGALTLRRVGILGALAGAVALAAPFAPAAWRWFWPDPVATIDVPLTNESLSGCFEMRGRLDPTTFWRRRLWLIAARDGRAWRAVARVPPWSTTWAKSVCVHGQTGDHNRFALVVADSERDNAFRRQLIEPDDPPPSWLRHRHTEGKCCPGRMRGFQTIPEGARLLALVQLRIRQGDEPP